MIRRRHRRGLFGLFHCSLNENDPTSHLLYDLGKNFPGEFMVSGVVSSLFLVQLRCTVVIYDLYHNHNAATIYGRVTLGLTSCSRMSPLVVYVHIQQIQSVFIDLETSFRPFEELGVFFSSSLAPPAPPGE